MVVNNVMVVVVDVVDQGLNLFMVRVGKRPWCKAE